MSHDKISAAARKRMAETGESYAAARRAVIKDHQAASSGSRSQAAAWFAISYSDTWTGRLADSMDRVLFRAGRGVSGVEVHAEMIRVWMGSFKLDIPRPSVQSAHLSDARVGGTTGVHSRHGRWLVNGSAEGLVEVRIDPPAHVSPSLDTLFGLGPARVDQFVISLEEPGAFIEAATPAS